RNLQVIFARRKTYDRLISFVHKSLPVFSFLKPDISLTDFFFFYQRWEGKLIPRQPGLSYTIDKSLKMFFDCSTRFVLIGINNATVFTRAYFTLITNFNYFQNTGLVQSQ